jgi:signal transduction histidine kinase
LRELAAQNEKLLESERKHIAREVHDELGQVLTALRMDVSLLGMRFGYLDKSLEEKVPAIKALVDRAIQGVRNVAGNLRPSALDMGLVHSIEWLCNEFAKNSSAICTFNSRNENLNLDDARSVVVFRIVQESLTNITRYAQASQVNVSIGNRDNELWVEVRDNGLGFDPVSKSHRKSFGLLGMRERALALGGQVTIVSAPGLGTTINLTIPIDVDHDSKEDA